MQARRNLFLIALDISVFEDDDDDHDDGSSSRTERLMIDYALDACIRGSSGVTGLLKRCRTEAPTLVPLLERSGATATAATSDGDETATGTTTTTMTRTMMIDVPFPIVAQGIPPPPSPVPWFTCYEVG